MTHFISLNKGINIYLALLFTKHYIGQLLISCISPEKESSITKKCNQYIVEIKLKSVSLVIEHKSKIYNIIDYPRDRQIYLTEMANLLSPKNK